MNITEIIFRKTFDSGKLRAVVSIPTELAATLRTPSAELHVTNLKAQSLVHTRIMWQLTNLPKLRISRLNLHRLRHFVGAFYFLLYTLCVLTILIR